jgi:hypothetical protein
VRPTIFFGMPRVWDKLGEMLTAEHRQFSSVFAALSLWARSQVGSPFFAFHLSPLRSTDWSTTTNAQAAPPHALPCPTLVGTAAAAAYPIRRLRRLPEAWQN